jgi:Luciferase
MISLYEEARNFIRSMPDVKQKPDPLSAEAYFYGLRNFVHFHGQYHLDIRLSKPRQEQALQTGKALEHQFAPQAGWVSCVLETKEQLEVVMELIKQAYDYSVTQHVGKYASKAT